MRKNDFGAEVTASEPAMPANHEDHPVPPIEDDSGGNLPFLLETGVGLLSGLGADAGGVSEDMASLLERLRKGRFHLAVLGQFKRGKSTLLNALVGEPVLPVSVVPLTSIPTFIGFGERPQITVTYANNPTPECFTGHSTSDLTEFLTDRVTEESNPNNSLGVSDVEVNLPSSLLSRGVVLIDTPGIGSTYRHNTKATLDFLEQCDAALFLVSADLPITDAEVEFLRQVRAHVPKLFFVLNKMDCLGEKERNQLFSFFKKTLIEQLGEKDDVQIYRVSARQGLEARLNNDPRMWKGSGLEDLEQRLIRFLTQEKLSELKRVIARRGRNVIESALMRIRISLESLQLPGEVLAEKIRIFEKTLQQASRERNIIQDILEGDKKRLTVFLEDRCTALKEETAAALKDIRMKGGVSGGGRFSEKEKVQAAWADFLPIFFDKKSTELTQEVQTCLVDALTPHKQRIETLVELLRKTAAELFQIPYRPLDTDNILKTGKKPYWVLNAWNTVAAPVLLSLETRMDDLVRRNVENLRWSTLQNIIVAFSRFASDLKQRIDETVASTKGAMETVHQRKKDHAGSVEDDIQRLKEIVSALENLQKHLAAIEHRVS